MLCRNLCVIEGEVRGGGGGGSSHRDTRKRDDNVSDNLAGQHHRAEKVNHYDSFRARGEIVRTRKSFSIQYINICLVSPFFFYF